MRHPDRAIALLRVVVGAWFLKAAWTKVGVAVLAGVLPYPVVSTRFLAVHVRRVAEFAAGNPLAWYRHGLETVVLPHAAVFATLQTFAEVIVGVGLVFGILVRPAATLGLVLALAYGLATQWMSFGQQGFHVLLATSMMLFVVTGAGRRWGLDAWLRERGGARAWLGWLT